MSNSSVSLTAVMSDWRTPKRLSRSTVLQTRSLVVTQSRPARRNRDQWGIRKSVLAAWGSPA
jgi:hypothetical protein